MTPREHQITTAQQGALYVCPDHRGIQVARAIAQANGRDDLTFVVLKALHPEVARNYPEVVFDHDCASTPADDMPEFLRRVT